MERKIARLALLLVLVGGAFVWGRLCAGWGRKRGWDEAKSGRVAIGVALAALVPAFWEMSVYFGIMPAMAIVARWSCFRVLRPGVPFKEMDQEFPSVDHRLITLNLSPVEPRKEVR